MRDLSLSPEQCPRPQMIRLSGHQMMSQASLMMEPSKCSPPTNVSPSESGMTAFVHVLCNEMYFDLSILFNVMSQPIVACLTSTRRSILLHMCSRDVAPSHITLLLTDVWLQHHSVLSLSAVCSELYLLRQSSSCDTTAASVSLHQLTFSPSRSPMMLTSSAHRDVATTHWHHSTQLATTVNRFITSAKHLWMTQSGIDKRLWSRHC